MKLLFDSNHIIEYIEPEVTVDFKVKLMFGLYILSRALRDYVKDAHII